MPELVKYRNWVFEVDRSKTESLYDKVKLSGTESCGCGQCKEFIALKDIIYPQEIKELFKKLGVDIYKEFELCDHGNEEYGHVYSWWFHFVGKIIEGDDCNISLPESDYTRNTLAINDLFSIGFTKDISISFFNNYQDLIQVELFAKVPWNKPDIIEKIKTVYN